MSGLLPFVGAGPAAVGKTASPFTAGLPSLSGLPGLSGGPATSGNGDSIFNNDSKLGGLNYNKGLPTWAMLVVAGVGAWAVWRVTS